MTLQNGITIIHGNKLESLVSVVEYWIKAHPLSPLESEIFLIYNNGVGQWLKQYLAQNSSLGIASGLEVKLPSVFVWEIYRTVLKQQIPTEQPLAKHPLTWRLYRLLPKLIKNPCFENLKNFLIDDKNEIKKHQLAEKLAELFDQYQMYRADWLIDWEEGKDIIRDGHNQEMPLPVPQLWQAQLWREILIDMGNVDKQSASRSAVHDLFMKEIDAMQSYEVNLPKRVIVLGIPTLAQQHIEVLAKISQFCQVILFVTNPCQYYWADIIEDRDLLKAQHRRQKNKKGVPESFSDEDLHLYANPLLAAWGKQGRDYIRLLDQFDERNSEQQWNWADDKIDYFEDYAENNNSCLLQKLQQTILDLEPIPSKKIELLQFDHSVTFHIAHSPQREVEILHDQLLARFNDQTENAVRLKPRDILVMVPDINKYAPHIHAVFGQLQLEDKRYIPYSVTDQQERGHNSLVVATEFLLSLPNSRFTVSQIRWLLEIPAIRNRLGIEVENVPKLCQWMEGAQIRWGLDSKHRASLDITEGLEANTWKFGLHRMLLGYAVGQGEAFCNIEPYEEIGGLEAQWLGSLCCLMDLLERYTLKLSNDYAYKTWLDLLEALFTDFFQPNDDKERKTLEALQCALTKWGGYCQQANLTETDLLSRSVVCDSWLSGVDEASFQKIFLSGKVNFCTLMPMRSIPFSVICILGMNDGDYPRQKNLQNFDLMSLAGQYRPGDRSRRQDDQYVFLEALLSARKQFYISWVGRSVRDNSKIPPSVLVSQLRETLDRIWCLSDKNLLDEITLEHPLQPFSQHYLENNEYPRLFTYAKEWFLEISQKRAYLNITTETEQEATFVLDVATLSRFLKSPVKTYCNQALKFYFSNDSKMSEDNEPFSFNKLEEYHFKDELLSELNNTTKNIETFFAQKQQQWIHKGELPLGNFAAISFEQVSLPIQQAWINYQTYLALWTIKCEPMLIEIPCIMKDGVKVRLSDSIKNLRKNSTNNVAILSIVAQNLKNRPDNLCQHWIKHLVVCASTVEDIFSATYIFGSDIVMTFPHIAKIEAIQYLEKIVNAWYQNQSDVLPIAIKSCFAFLEKHNLSDAKIKYEEYYNGTEIDSDPYLKRIFPTFEDLIHNNHFQQWANELYLPIQEYAKEVKK